MQSSELGSGVIINKEKGYVVTNNHVVKDADRITVRLLNGDEFRARLVGADPKSDLAVLQIKANLSVQAEWGDSDKLDIGDWVLAIGSPLGLDHSVSAGIVSATERNDLGISDYESFIQTDAAINPGNSGGPLIDLGGKVVGINSALISKSGAYEGIGLAIPSVLARRVVESLIKEGKVVRGYLGVRLAQLDQAAARELKLPKNRGALVADVQPGSPAEQIGLKAKDVIVSLADREVADPASLRNLTANLDAGSSVPITFYRDGAPTTATVTIAELPPAPELLSTLGFGLHERPMENESNRTIVEIDRVFPAGIAYRSGLRPGMRILGVGEPPQPVSNLVEFETAVRRLDLSRGLPLVIQTPDGAVGPIRLGIGKPSGE
jgi:serine protease Do